MSSWEVKPAWNLVLSWVFSLWLGQKKGLCHCEHLGWSKPSRALLSSGSGFARSRVGFLLPKKAHLGRVLCSAWWEAAADKGAESPGLTGSEMDEVQHKGAFSWLCLCFFSSWTSSCAAPLQEKLLGGIRVFFIFCTMSLLCVSS